MTEPPSKLDVTGKAKWEPGIRQIDPDMTVIAQNGSIDGAPIILTWEELDVITSMLDGAFIPRARRHAVLHALKLQVEEVAKDLEAAMTAVNDLRAARERDVAKLQTMAREAWAEGRGRVVDGEERAL